MLDAYRSRMWLLCLALLAGEGCQRQQAAPAKLPPPKVKFTVPVRETIQETEEFPGRTAAVEVVDIRSRVTGYLTKVGFEDGAHVQSGALLFVIDPRTYEAELSRAKANIEQFQARVQRLDRQQSRARELFEKQAISQDEAETIQYDRSEAQASLEAATAAHEMAKLNLEFTQIRSPLEGRISRRLVDPGNLVMANETLLATLVPVDRLYVYFDMDERTVLRLRRQQGASAARVSGDGQVQVQIALADQEKFDLTGVVDFEDNQIDPATGTLRMRAVVENTSGLLSPGLFARVRFPIGKPSRALLIPEESLGSDQGRPFVYVLDGENKVQYRSVETGIQVGGRRVIRSGIELGERVVMTGLQRVRRKMQVEVEPSDNPAAGRAPPPTAVGEKSAAPAESERTADVTQVAPESSATASSVASEVKAPGAAATTAVAGELPAVVPAKSPPSEGPVPAPGP